MTDTKVKLKTDERRIIKTINPNQYRFKSINAVDRVHTGHIQELLVTVWFSFMKTLVQFDWQHKEMRHMALTQTLPHKMWCLYGVSHTWSETLWTSVEVREIFRDIHPSRRRRVVHRKADYKVRHGWDFFPLEDRIKAVTTGDDDRLQTKRIAPRLNRKLFWEVQWCSMCIYCKTPLFSSMTTHNERIQ